ncbi:MAG TPA: response regulator [Candidatus Acidoferrales bacterium]|jgi:two-component system phosphate regulon response regulator PhoB|nr:response regulator [Candidatus Acidoferrales bacterium]
MQRILIIDDDEAMRDLLRDRLEDTYQIIDTGDPEQAIALALQHKPDAVLLDLMMMTFSGFEVCQTLSTLSLTQRFPIFVISGEMAAKYKTFCQNLGASDYFEKPVDFGLLRSKLCATLKLSRVERRKEVRIRLNVALKLRGRDKNGRQLEVLATTENVSTGGFLCGCEAIFEINSILDVFLCCDGEHYAGSARTVRQDPGNDSHSRYAFQFVQKPIVWVLK